MSIKMSLMILLHSLLRLIYQTQSQTLVPEYQSGKVNGISLSVGGSQMITVTFSPPFTSAPKVLVVWQSLDLNTGPNQFKMIGPDPSGTTITTSQFQITEVAWTSIHGISVEWLAILDSNIYMMQTTMAQPATNSITVSTISFNTVLSGTISCAFFLNLVRQSATPSSDRVQFRFFQQSFQNNSVTIQLETMPAGYLLYYAQLTIVYASNKYMLYQELQGNFPNTYNMMTLDARAKVAIVGINGIQCQTEVNVSISNSAGSVTVTKSANTVFQSIQLSMLVYMPCSSYCTACTAGFPKCDACVTGTQRSGDECKTCPAQKFQTSTVLNCQNCSTICDNCSGTATHCTQCPAINHTISPPDCNTCNPNWFISGNICYQCATICNGCSGTSTTCTACSTSSFRINAPSCNQCPPNKTLVPGMEICQDCPINYFLSGSCQPCQSYCDGCITVDTNCIACQSATQRLIISQCTTCPSQMFLEIGNDNCQQCANYCEECSGNNLNCTSCLASTLRQGAPQCLQCPSKYYQTNTNINCLRKNSIIQQACSNYCNECININSQCTLCNISSLRTDPPNCTTCPSHYYLVSNMLNCQLCSQQCNDCINNELQCLTCSLASKRLNPPNCQECPLFTYPSNDSCIQCDPSCSTCNQLGCVTCLTESQFINQNHVCVNCPTHCTSCDNYNCYSCSGNCKLCDLNACLQCNSDNYYLSGTNCAQCPDGCSNCNSEQQCLTCLENRILINNLCQCQTPCLTCDSQQCLSCISDEYKLINKKCINCPSRCLICDNNANCVQSPQNCKTATITQMFQVQCIACEQNYFLQDNFCNKCAIQCLECTDSAENCINCRFQTNQPTNSCSICEHQSGYYSNLSNNSCYTKCGDGIQAGNEECDDGNYAQMDGCTNCRVDIGYYCQGFICQQIRHPIPTIQENLNQTSFYNNNKSLFLNYDIPINNLNITSQCSFYFNDNISFIYSWNQIDQQNYQINFTLQNQSINSILNIRFLNNTAIKSEVGINQQIQTLSIQISNYIEISGAEQNIADATNASIPYVIITIIACVCLAVLFGGIETYWNLLDLLQTISYLQYINTFQPFNVNSFLNQFSFLQFQNLPINQKLNTQNYVQGYINTDDFKTPTGVVANSGYTCSTILNMIPIANLFTMMTLLYCSAKVIGPYINKIQIKKVTFSALNRQMKFYLFIYKLKHFLIDWCKNLDQQWVWSGILRFYISSAYEISFIIALGIYGFQYGNQTLITKVDSIITMIVILMHLSLSVAITIICGFNKQTLSTKTNRYGSVYEGLSFKKHSKYYHILTLHKKFVFTLILILLYDEPMFQIFGIILKPLISRLEKYKQTLSELMMLFSQCSLGVLIADDYNQFLIYDYRIYCGWACISFLGIMISAQLFIDTFQQFKEYYRQFPFLRRIVNHCIGKKPPLKKIFTEIHS